MMGFKITVLGSVVLASLSSASSIFSRDSSSELKMNHVQVIGTHNSYHIETTLTERPVLESLIGQAGARTLYYSHPSLTDQFQYQSVRGLELDLFADSMGGMFATPLIRNLTNTPYPSAPEWKQPGTKVLHVADIDVNTRCVNFVSCLQEIKAWSRANKGHTLIPIMLEFKTADAKIVAAGGAPGEAWNADNLDTVDREIFSVFKQSEILTPDDVRKKGLTLEESVLKNGWPSHKDAKNKVMFLMDNEPNPGSIRDIYRGTTHLNLEKRAIFTNSNPGQADAAFLKRNDPLGPNIKVIQDLVKKGYFVRTRSDVPLDNALKEDYTMMNAAFESGAQFISTDFQGVGMASRWNSSFVSKFPGLKIGEGRGSVRCNPVLAGKKCDDGDLENLKN